MKVNELMTGDLVRVSKDVWVEKGAIVRVRAIDSDNNIPEKGLIGCVTCVRINDPYLMSGGVWAEYLEPIPLTTEILENNGFEVQEQGGGRKDVWIGFGLDREGDIEVEFQNNIPTHLKIDGVFKGEYYTSTNIRYVHQLQHALRLCGIEEEIEL